MIGVAGTLLLLCIADMLEDAAAGMLEDELLCVPATPLE